MRDNIKQFWGDNNGQFGLWLGLLAFPLLLSVSLAVDFNEAERTRSGLKSALDSAALAAVMNQNLTEAERGDYAQTYFDQNFPYSDEFTLTVGSAKAERVELAANGKSAVSISRAAGVGGFEVAERSVAVLTKEDVICVLTLNPDGADSFLVKDASEFSAPSCSVQVNSSNKKAANVALLSNAHAKSFCTVGGVRGQFYPFVNTECSPVADPYINFIGPSAGQCTNDAQLVLKEVLSLVDGVIGAVFENETIAIAGDNITLRPGTYCESIKIVGYNVTFAPGTYIMSNASLEFKQGATARADDVTFVLQGKKSKIKVESGSSLYVKAPSEGKYAGLAIYQDPALAQIDKNGKVGKKPKMPSAKSELKGGASMSILGTVYLPTQELKVGTGSGLGTKAPATSFIAYDVAFEGGARIEVAVDHVAAGLPPLLPRSDDGARLVE